ncbi:hypothetical protein RchiOBHm_Chr5g0019041 [Rosa chinensis]|uniref:Uncharacterized protein n=1 Tax=Rosa chinensis TaxID=74649 RepID=A0A2P6Q6X1_ROSCH|nr:hypothetical protein RchiOBHm_Chr5g0019041 [Rosa chinensis]
MAIDRASSGLQYPERFYVAASYASFDGSPHSSSKAVRAKFNSESALILYALYKQFTWLVKDRLKCQGKMDFS